MKKIDKLEFFMSLLYVTVAVAFSFAYIGNLQTSYIKCADHQCTAVTKILFLNSTPVKTFNQVDVDEVVVTIEEKDASSKRLKPETLAITVIYRDMSDQKIATSTDEKQILNAASSLRSYLNEPDGNDLSIALGPMGYDKYKFFLGLAFLSFFFASWFIPRVFGPF